MPNTQYSVKFPDGHVQTFNGPDSMSDVDVQNRAIQERSFAEDKIPSTFYQGAKQSVGDTLAADSGKVGTAVSLAGALAGQPAIVAAGPLVGRAVKAGGESMAGRTVTPTSASELGTLGAEGVVSAYGPAVVASGLRGFAQAAPAIRGHGLMPWAVKTAGQAAAPVAEAVESATPQTIGSAFGADAKTVGDTVARVSRGVSAEDLQLVMDQIAAGTRPSTAIKIVAAGDPKLFGNLMTLYLRARSVKP